MPAVLPCRCRESSDDRLASVAELEGLLSSSETDGGASRRPPRAAAALPVARVWAIWAAWAGGTVLVLSLGWAFDLQLSTAWADGHSGWGNVLADCGEWPGYAAAGLGALVLLVEEAAAPQAELRKAMFLVRAVGLGLVVVFTILRRTGSLGAAVAVPVVLPVCVVLPRGAEGKARLRARLEPWRPLAIHLVLLFLIAGGMLESIKDTWGRARPRMVLSGDAHAAHGASWPPNEHCQQAQPPGPYHCDFSPWWEPQVRKRLSFVLDFLAKNGYYTKTGFGQTHRKLSNKGRFAWPGASHWAAVVPLRPCV
jgi:hypothetical protein